MVSRFKRYGVALAAALCLVLLMASAALCASPDPNFVAGVTTASDTATANVAAFVPILVVVLLALLGIPWLRWGIGQMRPRGR
jgi:hypothetical protein